MQPTQHENTLSQNLALDEDNPVLKEGIWPSSLALWMAAFYLALYIIRPWEQLFPWLAIIHPERIYMIGLMVVVFFSKEERRSRLSWQSVTVLMFLAAVALASACAIRPELAWDPFYAYVAVVVFYFILLSVIRSPQELVFILLCYIAIMCMYLGKAEWEFFVNGQHRYDMGVVRMEGIETTFGGPNNLGISIVASLPFALFLWRNMSSFTTMWPEKWKVRCRRGLFLYGCLAVTSIVLTNSRSSMIGFVVFVSLVMLSGKGFARKLKYLLIGIATLALLWAFMPAENKGRLSTIWAPEEGPANAQESAEGRIAGYKAGMEMFRRYPVTGVGLGNFIPYRVLNVDGIPLEAHNLAGQLLGEMGLVGGFTFMLMLAAIQSASGQVIKLAKQQADTVVVMLADLASACRMSLFLLLFLGLFGHNLYRANWLWIMAFSILALRFTQEKLETKRMV